MTAAAARLCLHHWWTTTPPCGEWLDWHHHCAQPADHPPPCRCRCGDTTTRERTDP